MFGHPEPQIIVPVLRVVVVPVRGARIPLIVVERAPAPDAIHLQLADLPRTIFA